ncbi:unnamed protein product, partial [Ranitomeya imitator]
NSSSSHLSTSYRAILPPVTTAPPTEEPCKNVLCEPPVKCTKNGAGLVEIPWENICCPRYECQCQVPCNPPPICQDLSPPFRIGDPDVDCCPAYEYRDTYHNSSPQMCGSHLSYHHLHRRWQLSGSGLRRSMLPKIRTPTPNPCDGVTCAEHQCPAGENLLVKQTSDDPCCPAYECVPSETTPPPVWTPTPGKCDNVICQTVDCFMTGSKKVLISVEDCCPVYDCECEPCSPAPACNGNKPIMTIDPEMDCCPKYKCPEEATPPPKPTPTTPAPTTSEPCKDVLCEPITCDKKGSTLDIIPWAESCCPHFVCVCKIECDPPICYDGRPPVRVGDPDTECCPEYKCEPPLPPCENVICPVIQCAVGEIAIEYDGDDPCCRQTDCVPITPVPTVPPTAPSTCDSVTCIVPECRENEKRIVKIDSDDPCCPLYECAPPPTPPSTTPEIPNNCSEECPVIECHKIGTIREFAGGDDPCCPQYKCVCQPCDPAPNCGQNSQAVIKEFDIDSECCPTYDCITKIETTTPIIITTPIPTPSARSHAVPFLNVKMAYHQSERKTLKSTAAQNTYALCTGVNCFVPPCDIPAVLVEVPGDDHCCKSYDLHKRQRKFAMCPLCEPNNCDVRDTVLVKVDPVDGCCPVYQCIPPTTTPPETTPTSEECEGVVCQVEECTKEGSYAVSVGRDECCETYACAPPPPTPTIPSTTLPMADHHSELKTPNFTAAQNMNACQDVTCVIPTCRQDYSLIEVSSNDPCCKSYECNPPPTAPPTTEVPPCDFSGCSPTDCDDGYTLMVKYNPEDDCCPTYE